MKILKFPELEQTYSWDCGAKAAQAVLGYYGLDIREDKIMEITGTNQNGTSINGLKNAIEAFGLKYDAGDMKIEKIKDFLDSKIPVIILLQAWAEREFDWENDWIDGHFVVAIGYDENKIYFEDPSFLKRTYLNFDEFEKRWHDVDTDGKKYWNWGMAVFGVAPDEDSEKAIHMK